jgi:hypothetical protein
MNAAAWRARSSMRAIRPALCSGAMSFLSKLLGRKPEQTAAPSPHEVFAAEVANVLRQTPGVSGATFDADKFSFAVEAGDESWTLFLHNLFAETRELSPAARAERIQALVRSVQPAVADELDWDEARPGLVPLLRVATNFAAMPVAADKQPYGRPFLPFLIECVGLDSSASTAFVGSQLAEPWGQAPDTLYECARANLLAHVEAGDDTASFDASAAFPIWCVSRDDSYEASRLLLPGWLASFRGRVHGRPIAIVPERATLIVGGDADDACIERLIDTAQRQYQSSPRSISPALYTVDDQGRVIPFELPVTHPLANKVALGHITLAANEYAAQKQVLEERLTEDVYIGELSAVKRTSNGSYYSYTTWGKGVMSLLPQADELVLIEDTPDVQDKSLALSWETALTALGECLVREPGMDPPRWRTVAWPSQDVLAALAATRR